MAPISTKCVKSKAEVTRWLLGVTGCRLFIMCAQQNYTTMHKCCHNNTAMTDKPENKAGLLYYINS